MSGNLPGRRGFTLIEVLIVTSVMLILSGVAITSVGENLEDVKQKAAEHDAATLQRAIEVYRAEHQGLVPMLALRRLPQLLMPTNRRGKIGPNDDAHPFGPYIAGSHLSVNPLTGSNRVTATVDFPPTTFFGGGWLYHEGTGQITYDHPIATPTAKETLDGGKAEDVNLSL